jgi:glucokinase
VRGAHGAAGEIGYTTFSQSAVSDGAAPLEELAGGRAIAARASKLLGTTTTVESLVERSDPLATALLHDATAALATAMGNLAVVLDPERIVVGGGLAASFTQIVPLLEARLRQSVPFPPEIVAARFASDASLHGAVALALDAVAGPGQEAVARLPGPARPDSKQAITVARTQGAASCS